MLLSRRRVIAALAAATVSPRLALAGPVAVRVGYVPVIGASAFYVLDRLGWAADAGLQLTTSKFDTGAAAIQAFASGNFDLMAIGVAPVAVARSRGFDATVVAAGGSGGSAFICTDALGQHFAAAHNAPAAALAAFRKKVGHPAKLATLPPGGVPTTALSHWLFEQSKTDPSDVDLVAIGIEAAQQAMLAGAIDGGILLEPAATIVQMRNPGLKRIASSLDMFPAVPGIVYAVSRRFLTAHRAEVVTLVRLLARATTLIRQTPDQAAPSVAAVLGGGLIEPATMVRAMTSGAIDFVSDPHSIVAPTQALLAYETKIGDFAQAPSTADLFDLSVWDEAAR